MGNLGINPQMAQAQPQMPMQQQQQQPAQAHPAPDMTERSPNPQIIQALELKMHQVGPEGQQIVTKALSDYPDLPFMLGVVYGIESEQYFTQIQQMLSQQNSQAEGPETPIASPENPAEAEMSPDAGTTAEATSNIPVGM